jgi:hypothetical protein
MLVKIESKINFINFLWKKSDDSSFGPWHVQPSYILNWREQQVARRRPTSTRKIAARWKDIHAEIAETVYNSWSSLFLKQKLFQKTGK